MGDDVVTYALDGHVVGRRPGTVRALTGVELLRDGDRPVLTDHRVEGRAEAATQPTRITAATTTNVTTIDDRRSRAQSIASPSPYGPSARGVPIRSVVLRARSQDPVVACPPWAVDQRRRIAVVGIQAPMRLNGARWRRAGRHPRRIAMRSRMSPAVEPADHAAQHCADRTEGDVRVVVRAAW